MTESALERSLFRTSTDLWSWNRRSAWIVNHIPSEQIRIAKLLEIYDVITELITKGVDINAKDKYGKTALGNAVNANSAHVVQLLLEAGARPDEYMLESALELKDGGYVEHPDTDKFPYVVALLIKSGVDVEYSASVSGPLRPRGKNEGFVDGKRTPLHFVAETHKSVYCVKLLIDAGADVNKADRNGNTALHEVCECILHPNNGPNPYMALALLMNGADRDLENRSPGYFLSPKSPVSIIDELVKKQKLAYMYGIQLINSPESNYGDLSDEEMELFWSSAFIDTDPMYRNDDYDDDEHIVLYNTRTWVFAEFMQLLFSTLDKNPGIRGLDMVVIMDKCIDEHIATEQMEFKKIELLDMFESWSSKKLELLT
ncbi:ankyrin repeat-containing domain protein [Baffinella frigidus]|nr:ankyrin repeat-containing domain protein [Cryptophyta sp. CCMP2293]